MGKRSLEPATPREVRDWAAKQGLEVGARGRLSASVLEAYTKATKRPIASA